MPGQQRLIGRRQGRGRRESRVVLGLRRNSTGLGCVADAGEGGQDFLTGVRGPRMSDATIDYSGICNRSRRRAHLDAVDMSACAHSHRSWCPTATVLAAEIGWDGYTPSGYEAFSARRSATNPGNSILRLPELVRHRTLPRADN